LEKKTEGEKEGEEGGRGKGPKTKFHRSVTGIQKDKGFVRRERKVLEKEGTN